MGGRKIFTLPVFHPSNLPFTKNQMRFSLDKRRLEGRKFGFGEYMKGYENNVRSARNSNTRGWVLLVR